MVEQTPGKSGQASTPLDARVESLAASWQVEPAVAWYLIRPYAMQASISTEAAVDALEDLSYDEASKEIGLA